MYRILSHTADVGLELEAPSLEALFESAARGWKELVLENSPVAPVQTRSIEIRSPDLDDLLVQWLSELNYLLTVKYWVAGVYEKISVKREKNHWICRAVVKGETMNPQKHQIHFEIKAVTYHQLHIQKENGLYRTRVIFDI